MNPLRATVLLVLSTVSSNAFAYLDPGAVSLRLQALFAALAAAALFWRYWFWRVMGFFGLKKGKRRPQEILRLRSQQQDDGR